jgi:hypothetical protein
MSLKLPRLDRVLTIVTPKFTPTSMFHQWWQQVVVAIEEAFTTLETSVFNIQAALDAAGIAQAAADAAQTAADTAQAAADAAQASATGTNTLVTTVNSGININPLSALDAGTDASIVIANHTRLYADGTSVAVTGTTLNGLTYSTEYWVYYDDPTHSGGAVSYVATIVSTDAAQVGVRHLVGSITTPAAAAPDATGYYIRYPGLGDLLP